MAEKKLTSGSDIYPNAKLCTLSAGDTSVPIPIHNAPFFGMTINELGSGASVEVRFIAGEKFSAFAGAGCVAFTDDGTTNPFTAVGASRKLDARGFHYVQLKAIGGSAEVALSL